MKIFSCEIPLRWGDMDAMGHLNNVVYFRLFEEARVQWFCQFGWPTEPSHTAAILAHISCDFAKPMVYPATALVRQEVVRLGRSSVELELSIERVGEPGVVVAKGRSVIVWYDYQANQSVPWPAAIREALS